MTTEEIRNCIAFTTLVKMNKPLALHILKNVETVEMVFREKESTLNQIISLRNGIFGDNERKKALLAADEEIAFVIKKDITPLFFTDSRFPQRLSDCPDAPILLYYKGDTDLNTQKIVSIVGTRHATNYGRGFCDDFIAQLALHYPDTLIVSGMAYGIDIAAHRAAVAKNCPTVGVLAHGLNTLYPANHRNTAVAMLSNGGLLTEYPSNHPIKKWNFVSRNRIVAGMSDATIIVESAEKGGSLITAEIAASYFREVFALPGRMGDTYSKGCNKLIYSNKATLIKSPESFFDTMGWDTTQSQQMELFPELPEEENTIVQMLQSCGELQINQLAVASDIPTHRILASLLELEFKGIVRTFPGGVYRLV